MRLALGVAAGLAVFLGGALQAALFLLWHEHPLPSDWAVALAVAVSVAALVGTVAWYAAGRVAAPVAALAETVSAVAAGDLSHPPPPPVGSGELDELSRSFAAMAAGLRATLADLHDSAGTLEREAAEILGGVTRLAATASQQAAAISQTSTTAAEIAQTAKQATAHADSVIQMTQRSEDLSRDGLDVVEEAVEASAALGAQVKRIAALMGDLSERTQQVGEIIQTVKDLAEQSNLLALNASIEASKAGEQGRGFAVVAMEMRTLAEQSKQAAVQIRAMLGDIQKGSREAAAATDEGSARATAAMGLARSAGEAIEGLALVIRESAVAARQIANNTRQQTIGVEQMVAAIGELSHTIHESADGARAIEQGANALTAQAQSVTAAVRRYRV